MKNLVFVFMLFASLCGVLTAASKQVRVFVASCDNKTQGIQPVAANIGNGDDAQSNLYWGCSDGFAGFFTKSKQWKVIANKKDLNATVLSELSLKHSLQDIELIAYAYRGSAIKQCITDFEQAAACAKHDLVVYIGHNGLMDFEVPAPKWECTNTTDVMVLCCMSDKYFSQRLRISGCRTRLMTSQLMYPGSFLLHAALEQWGKGASNADILGAAAASYAQNQKISPAAAKGVFTKLQETKATGDKPLSKIQQEKIEKLFAKLVSPNQPYKIDPEHPNSTWEIPERYSEAAQQKIEKVIDEIEQMGIEVIPFLIKHMDDERYCRSAIYSCMVNESVGSVCHNIFERKVKGLDARPGYKGQPDSYPYCHDVAKWWQERKKMTLDEIWRELLRHNIELEKKMLENMKTDSSAAECKEYYEKYVVPNEKLLLKVTATAQ